MRRLPAIAGCAFALSLAVPAGATASGGPVPAVQGGAGVTLPGSDVRYQAIAARGGTLVQRVRVAGGTIERFREIRGRFGVPGAAFDGSTTGLSADGRTLVLAE